MANIFSVGDNSYEKVRNKKISIITITTKNKIKTRHKILFKYIGLFNHLYNSLGQSILD